MQLLFCWHVFTGNGTKFYVVLMHLDFFPSKGKDVNKNGRRKFSSCFTYVCRGAHETESDFNRLLGSQKIVHIVTEGQVFHHVCTHMKNPD